ncbi:MAG: NAD(P)H-dependent oxidoreductase [Flavobacteriales bacterium]|jgi:NAD(P)H-dependent FMN reductase|nr:NAD(P)H-dependent oxidoreductase [Flavobacteriales bacterium]
MITIIAGTNRPDSNSERIANFYHHLLPDESQVLALKDLPRDFVYADTYGDGSDAFNAIVDSNIIKADKFIFIIPEYNGGFPGVLKAFIDAVHPKHFNDKKAALVGLSSGHSGALRPMDQFSDILHYLKVEVLSAKPKLSGIENLITDNQLTDERAIGLLKDQIDRFAKF